MVRGHKGRTFVSFLSALAALSGGAHAAGIDVKDQGTPLTVGNTPSVNVGGILSSVPSCAGSTLGAFMASSGSVNVLMGFEDPEKLAKSCSTLANAGGGSYAAGAEAYKRSAEAALNRLKGASEEISCAIDSKKAIDASLKAFEPQVEKYLADARNQVTQYQQWIEDTKEKIKFIDNEIGPDIQKAAKDLSEFEISGAAVQTQFEKRIRDLKASEIAAVQMTDAATMKSAMTCFKDEKSMETPCPDSAGNLAPASAYDHAICVYQKQVIVGPNGRFQPLARGDRSMRAKVAAAGASMSTVLNDMVSGVPDPAAMAPKMGKEGQAIAFDAGRSYTNMTPAQLQINFESKLDALGKLGTVSNQRSIPIKQFVLGKIQACYNRSKTAMRNSSQVAMGPVYQFQEAIKMQREEIRRDFQGNFAKAQQAWTSATSALGRSSGVSEQLQLAKCNDADVTGQMQCFTNIRTQLRGMLYGGTPNSRRTLVVRGSQKGADFAFECDGLKASAVNGLPGCVDGLRNLRTNFTTLGKQQEANLAQFKTQFDGNFRQSLRNSALGLSQYSAAMQQRNGMLGANLAALGISARPRMAKRDAVSIVAGKDGIPEMPVPLEDAMAAMLTPPAQEFDEDSLQSVQKEIAKKQEKAAALLSSIDSVKGECESADKEKYQKKLADYIDRCRDTERDCYRGGGLSWVKEFSQKTYAGGGSIDAFGMSTLFTGADTAGCSTEALKTDAQERAEAKKRLTEAQSLARDCHKRNPEVTEATEEKTGRVIRKDACAGLDKEVEQATAYYTSFKTDSSTGERVQSFSTGQCQQLAAGLEKGAYGFSKKAAPHESADDAL